MDSTPVLYKNRYNNWHEGRLINLNIKSLYFNFFFLLKSKFICKKKICSQLKKNMIWDDPLLKCPQCVHCSQLSTISKMSTKVSSTEHSTLRLHHYLDNNLSVRYHLGTTSQWGIIWGQPLSEVSSGDILSVRCHLGTTSPLGITVGLFHTKTATGQPPCTEMSSNNDLCIRYHM
jgi:hypothetical protein